MKVLQAIENVHSAYETGSRQVLVACDDRNWWVCKSGYQPFVIFNEVIAAQFAKIWGIRVPASAFTQVQSWNLNIEDVERKLSDALFSDQWLASCEDTFRDFIKFFILN